VRGIWAIDPDLDWIVMKCLEKDRARRYETANGLAADIQRHLSNEPVVACPPSNLYRFQKMVRRNKLAFGAAGAVLFALLLGLAASSGRSSKNESPCGAPSPRNSTPKPKPPKASKSPAFSRTC